MSEMTDAGANETIERSASRASEPDPRARRVARAYGLIGVTAALVFWAPYVFTGLGWVRLSGPLLGAGIVVLAAFNAYQASIGRPSLVVGVLVLLLTVVAIASPFLLEVESELVVGVTAAAAGLGALVSIYALVDGLRLKRSSTASD